MTDHQQRPEPDSFRDGGGRQHREPTSATHPREQPETHDSQAFYAHGTGSVVKKLNEADTAVTSHEFDDAIELLEDALDDLEQLREGPETDSA